MTNMLDMSDVRIMPVWLACRIGVTQAIVLKQAHWSMKNEYTRVKYEGRWWFKRGLDAWVESLPFYSKRTLRRALDELQQEGMLLSTTEINRLSRPDITEGYYQFDQTKWYTVVMEHERLNVEPTMSIRPQESIVDYGVDNLDTEEGVVNLSQDSDSLSLISDKMDTSSSIKELKKKGSSSPSEAEVILSSFEEGVKREEWQDRVRNNPTHGPTLADYWRSGLSEYKHAAKTQAEMSVADKKMLKTLVAALPDISYLERVLSNWEQFRTFAYEYDVKLPGKPRPKDLAHCRDAIVEFTAQQEASTEKFQQFDWDNPYLTENGDDDND